MTDLPDRLMDEARALRQAVNWPSNDSVAEIARALLAAEKRGAAMMREKCAEVVEEFHDGNPFPTVHGAIAAAIRRVEP